MIKATRDAASASRSSNNVLLYVYHLNEFKLRRRIRVHGTVRYPFTLSFSDYSNLYPLTDLLYACANLSGWHGLSTISFIGQDRLVAKCRRYRMQEKWDFIVLYIFIAWLEKRKKSIWMAMYVEVRATSVSSLTSILRMQNINHLKMCYKWQQRRMHSVSRSIYSFYKINSSIDISGALVSDYKFNYGNSYFHKGQLITFSDCRFILLNISWWNSVSEEEDVTALAYIPCYGVVVVGMSNGCIVMVPLDGKSSMWDITSCYFLFKFSWKPGSWCTRFHYFPPMVYSSSSLMRN